MLTKDTFKKNELNTIFSSIDGANHVLHLYSPTVNKYLIHASFLANGGGKAAYVTGEDPALIERKFKSFNTELSIFNPKDINKIMSYEKAVIDGASISPKVFRKEPKERRGEIDIIREYASHPKRERYLAKNFRNHSILCTYDISKLAPNIIKSLVKEHDKLILSTDTATILSSKRLSPKGLMDSRLIDEFVKRELKTVVLALIGKQPQCGREIQLEIYKNFGVLLSSGTLYPLLHELEKSKLLECVCGVKTKTYKPANEERIRKIISEHIQAKNFLNNFLQSTMIKR